MCIQFAAYKHAFAKKRLITYNQRARKGTPKRAVQSWMYRQSCISQATRANRDACKGDEGNPTIHARHSARENSQRRQNCVLKVKPHPMPIKNRAAANMIQLTEKKPRRLARMQITIPAKKGGFRPIMSEIWPASGLASNAPKTWMVIMVLGM